MHPVTPILRVAHGSHLYGTSTPTSDQDFKGVHLPSGEAILLQRAENHMKLGVESKIEGSLKNASDAIDEESFSVQRFFEMLMKGDTVATEVLFATPLTASPLYWPRVQAVGIQLLNRQCKGFVGYCVRQAAKYGIKGSRMTTVKGLLDVLNIQMLGRTISTKLGAIEPALRAWAMGKEHVSWENLPNPNGTDNWHLVCCDRKMSMNVHLTEAIKVYSRVWEEYGQRARAAMTNEGIDWKAVSHAVRVAGQAVELLEHGRITFPRPNAEYLLKIKQGLLPYAEVSEVLEYGVAEVQRVALLSQLPETSDHKLADALVRELYLEQLR